AYEYQALKVLERSGVTPKPYYLDDSKSEFPFGILIMEFLPGRHLDYSRDLLKAAKTFAEIHGLDFLKEEINFLKREPGPFTGIFNEAVSLLTVYFSSPRGDLKVKRILGKVLDYANKNKEQEKYLLREPWLTLINTEVNSHNFIINEESQTCHLIDWEKPIYGEPAQDLSMFLISTTTLWKGDYILSLEEEAGFLNEYIRHLSYNPLSKTLIERVRMFNFFNYLRAVSWCAMAWTEYTEPGRPLVNMNTFKKIKMYIEMDFIKKSFSEAF
ncbi:MAG: aminoglycoside phosphotransferase family protein, partial [Bacillota bacterium]